MIVLALSVIGFLFAAVPTLLFISNLRDYRLLPHPGAGARGRCSVLIPARNEERNIEPALRSILLSKDVDLELIVLDDGSVDATAELVARAAARDSRVSLVRGETLPDGWAGKNFACHQLARAARSPVLIFLDADVRVRPDALARTLRFLDESSASLISGVPHEETGSFVEKLVIPLIHFVLLGFLPIREMRRNGRPGFAAACGQVIALRREAYEHSGGHGAIRGHLHDGVALARRFREAGYGTDLFDGTDTFRCRMYRHGSEVWNGFAKNASEALAAPRLIVPATLVLLTGQVLPFLLMALASGTGARIWATAGVALLYVPRILALFRFRQSFLGALLHPLGILVLLAIQWYTFIRFLFKRPSVWRGRGYVPAPA